MDVIAVYGSGRKQGNSAFLVDRAVQNFQKVGAEVKKYYLTDMDMRPCIGCLKCRREPDCIWKDEMSILLKDIINSDFVIFGFPLYMYEASGIFSMMMNRLYPMLGGEIGKYRKRHENKRCMVIISQGAPIFMFGGVLRRVKRALQKLGFQVLGTVKCGFGFAVGSAERSKQSCKKVDKICRKVMN